MNEKNLLKKMFLTLIPLILTNSLGIFKYITNTFLVGNLIGVNAISVLSNTFAITLIFYSISISFSIAISVLISKTSSNKDNDNFNLNKIANCGYLFGIIIGFLLSIIIILFGKYFLRLLNTPIEIFTDSNMFLNLFAISFTPNFLQKNINEELRVLDKAKIPLILTGINIFLNNALLYLLIKMKYDILSIGLSNILSDIIMLLISVLYIRNNNDLKFNIKLFKIDLSYFKNFINIGIPIVFEQIVVSLVILFETSISNLGGITCNAAFGIVGKWEEIFFVFSQSIQSIMIIFISRYYDKNNKKILIAITKNALILLIVPIIIFVNITFIFTNFSCRIFIPDEEIVSKAVHYFKIAGVGYCLMPIAMLFNGFIIGSGKTKFLFITSIVSSIFEILTVIILKNYYYTTETNNSHIMEVLGIGIIIYTTTEIILNIGNYIKNMY